MINITYLEFLTFCMLIVSIITLFDGCAAIDAPVERQRRTSVVKRETFDMEA